MSKPKPLRTSEKDVQIGCTAFLELDGWRAIRTDPVSDRKRGKGFGELGMPDYLYVRYLPPLSGYKDPPDVATLHQLLWIEFKAPGKKPLKHQLEWHARESNRGALVLVVDGFEGFRAWYVNESGLNRSMLLR